MPARQQPDPDLWDRIVNTVDRAARPLARAESGYLSTHPGYGNLSPAGFANNSARVSPPSAGTYNALKEQQGRFGAVEHANAWDNRWMLGPVLAPPLVALGLAGAGLPAREAEPLAQDLMGREPWMRGGNTRQVQVGKRAHAAYRDEIKQRALEHDASETPYNWEYEPELQIDGRLYRPDSGSPGEPRGVRDLKNRIYEELKPDTPSGRAAGARRARMLDANGYKTELRFYNPGDFELESAVIPPRVRPTPPSLRLLPPGSGWGRARSGLGQGPRRY